MSGQVPEAGGSIRRLILASGSPRRKELLSLLGLPFVIKAAEVDERRLEGEPPGEMVLRLSRAKARAVPAPRADELVVAADTVVVLDDEVLGKPADECDALEMLRKLRACAHLVYTGVSLWHPSSGLLLSQAERTVVWMREYEDGELEQYVASGDPLDKAGAYAIQDPVFDPVAGVEGCWLNVMGLPLCLLGRLLAESGVPPAADVARSCSAYVQQRCDLSRSPLAAAAGGPGGEAGAGA